MDITILMVLGFSFLVIAGLIVFGLIKLRQHWQEKVHIYSPDHNNIGKELEEPCKRADSCKTFKDINADFLERRNEFWQVLGQFVIIIVIITILAVLLLASKISSEAALPIMAGLGSFGIGKGISTIKNNNSHDKTNEPNKH